MKPRIGTARRRSVGGAAQELVRWRRLLPDVDLPWLCEPAVAGVSLPEWAAGHRAEVEQR